MNDTGLAADQASMLETMFRRDYRWLERWLRRYVRVGQSEDIAAETIVRIVAMAASTCIHEPRAMMTTIARRLVYDLSARHALQRAYEETLAHSPPAFAPSTEERLITQEALVEIDRKLGKLAAKARSAFLLYNVDGMRQSEIAETLGVSVSMVRKYIVAGLRACYADEEDNDQVGTRTGRRRRGGDRLDDRLP